MSPFGLEAVLLCVCVLSAKIVGLLLNNLSTILRKKMA